MGREVEREFAMEKKINIQPSRKVPNCLTQMTGFRKDHFKEHLAAKVAELQMPP